MIQDDDELEIGRELKEALRPKLYLPIWNTIICSGPPLNLIFRYFIEREIKDPTVAIILTIITTLWTIINWYWYVKERNDFKKNWKEISKELETLNYKEEFSKDYMDIIFNSMQITAIVSLVAFFIFVAITLLSELSYVRYFALFSIGIFFLTSIGMIIIGVIQLFNIFKELKKARRLNNVLKRFFLIFTLLFIIQVILTFTMHKKLDWFEFIFYHLMMTIPIVIATEVAIIYKEIKKKIE